MKTIAVKFARLVWFKVTVKHDAGTVHIRTPDTSRRGAIESVMRMEGCPRNAVVAARNTRKPVIA